MSKATKTSRRAALGALVSAPALAVMPGVARAGASADETPVTQEQMAATSFEPWKRAVDEWTPPSNVEWADNAPVLLVPLRTAWILMYKTKAELETIAETLEEEVFDETLDGITEARKYFETIASILTGAQTRTVCAMASLAARQKSTAV